MAVAIMVRVPLGVHDLPGPTAKPTGALPTSIAATARHVAMPAAGATADSAMAVTGAAAVLQVDFRGASLKEDVGAVQIGQIPLAQFGIELGEPRGSRHVVPIDGFQVLVETLLGESLFVVADNRGRAAGFVRVRSRLEFKCPEQEQLSHTRRAGDNLHILYPEPGAVLDVFEGKSLTRLRVLGITHDVSSSAPAAWRYWSPCVC